MRLSTVGIVLASTLLAAPALATEGKGSKGSAPGGSSGGSESSTGQGSKDNVGQTGANDQLSARDVEADIVSGDTAKPKKWEVAGSFETHRLVRTSDLAGGEPTTPAVTEPGSGAADNKFMNAYSASIKYDITSKDRVSVRAYMYQRFLADQGENGFRFDDMLVNYTRLIPLPQKFRLQAGFSATLPTSYDSQISGLITALRGSLSLDRWFGGLDLTVRGSEEVYLQRYDSYAGSGGAAPNPLNRIAAVFDAEYHMPFHPPLSVGLSLYTAWTWYYNIGTGNLNGPGVNTSEAMNGIVQDPTFASQPIQQSYGGEVYVRYEMPTFTGIKSDLSVAYAQGDPTIGYTSLLHDGVGHAYLGYRQTSEVYASLGLRY
jgi:hypothetical protein